MKKDLKTLIAFAFITFASNAFSENENAWIHSDIPLYTVSPDVPGVTVTSTLEQRVVAGTEIASDWRAWHVSVGVTAPQLQKGDTFKVRWGNGSGETFVVEDVDSPTGSVPIPGTQLPAGSVGTRAGVGGCDSDCTTTAPVNPPTQGPGNSTFICTSTFPVNDPVDMISSCSWD